MITKITYLKRKLAMRNNHKNEKINAANNKQYEIILQDITRI